jgi:hypothetical protein
MAEPDSNLRIVESNLYDCEAFTGIELRDEVDESALFDRLNLTEMEGTASGAAISTDGLRHAGWSLHFSTILRCAGPQIVYAWSFAAGSPFLEFCNLCNNTATLAVVHSGAIAATLDHCWLIGNVGALFSMLTPSTETGFRISNCVLSGDLPDPSIIAESVHNFANSSFPSFFLSHRNSCFWPSRTPTMSRSPSEPLDCIVLVHLSARTSISSCSPCYEIRECFFVDILFVGSAGAISLNCPQPVYISDSTFRECRSTYEGGAIRVASSPLEVSRCCFLNCSSLWGSAAVAAGSAALFDFTQSNAFRCSGTMEGVLNILRTGPIAISNANFTENEHNETGGAVFWTVSGNYRWTLLFSTIVKCRGKTVIDSHATGEFPLIEFCNFYENAAWSALIWVYTWAPDMNYCVIFGTAGSNFEMQGAEPVRGFALMECVLSGGLPPESMRRLAQSVKVEAMTESLCLRQLDVCFELTATEPRNFTQSHAFTGGGDVYAFRRVFFRTRFCAYFMLL